MSADRARVRIPADVDREDRLIGGLTARQAAIAAAGGLVVWLGFVALREVFPLTVAAALVSPPAAVVVMLTVGRRDGLPADRWLAAGLRWWRAPRKLVAAPEGVPTQPAWAPRRPKKGERPPGALRLPVTTVTADGVLDLDGQGAAVVCEASTVNLALRTPREQQALVDALARWLNGLSGPCQVAVRSEQADLGPMIRDLSDGAARLPHPALEEAARDHARFLAELVAQHDVLQRRVLVVFRHPGPAPEAGEPLNRRVRDAARQLAAAGITLQRLDRTAAAAALARAADPGNPRPTEPSDAAAVVRGAAR